MLQIRIRGAVIQILRGTKKVVKSVEGEMEVVKHKTLGSIPVSVKSIKEVDKELAAKLTKHEHLQLEEYLDRYRKRQYDKPNPGSLSDISNLSKEVLEKLGENSKSKANMTDGVLVALAAYEALSRHLSSKGYGLDIVEIAHTQAFWNLENFKLKPRKARDVWACMQEFKDKLGKLGYTQKWYNQIRNV